MLSLQRSKVAQGRKTDAWSLAPKGCGRSVSLEVGTDLDSKSFVIGGDKGGLVENIMNKRQGEEATTLLLNRPPPEPPSWNAGEFRVWKQHFNFIVCLLFTFHDKTVYFSVDYFY
ncbi:unnamed protein product [Cuscuta europaea]|uniref:Uncharacterized protein n=1 Tax=Cuscuta europaea TaxID=41803 RepID=A0A9P0Z1C4_CUSEU|nr:unnamed protein product [Cuscuta europaea]